MPTIILTHYDRFSRLSPEYRFFRVAEALNSIPRREAFRWLIKHFKSAVIEDEETEETYVVWFGGGFNLEYDHKNHEFIAYA
jgi:hypothetical protein